MKFRSLLLVVACVITFAAPAAAQTLCPNPCVLTVGQTYSLLADHDGVDTTGYRVFVDNVKIGTDLSMNALLSGVATVSGLVAPARGPHAIQLAAFNEDWEVKSDPFPFTVKKKSPSKPGSSRITVTAQIVDGKIVFSVEEAEPE